jgi:hypothetical protein
MALEWLSRLLDGLSVFLGGSNPRSIWSYGRGSISENIFQDSQLRKFTPSYTHALNVENYNTKMGLLSKFSHAEQVVNLLDQQKQIDLSFIDSEIKTLREITIQDPEYTTYERVGKKVQPWERAVRPFSYGAGGGVRRWYIENPVGKAQYESEVKEFASYKDNALSRIKNQIDFFTKKRDLISSKSFSL